MRRSAASSQLRVTFNRRALALAAVVSAITVVALFAFLLVGGLLTCLAGWVTIAVKANTGRPSTTLSVGVGLLAGPALYLVLVGVIYLAN